MKDRLITTTMAMPWLEGGILIRTTKKKKKKAKTKQKNLSADVLLSYVLLCCEVQTGVCLKVKKNVLVCSISTEGERK